MQPVYVDQHYLYLLHGDRLFRSDHALDDIAPFARLIGKRARQRRLLPHAGRRIARLIARAVSACGNSLYLAIKDEIYRIDLTTGEAGLDFTIPGGMSLLTLAVVVANERAGICFGEYSANGGKRPVCVWRRSTADKPDWERLPLFPAGEIEHIHAIRQLGSGDVAILTGDFDNAASMWLCSPEFNELRRWSPPGQTYRACWLWEAPDGGCWWATDSQFEANRLMRVDSGASIADASIVSPLPGSAIYSAQGDRHFAFSTTVEPGATTGNRIWDLLTRKPGPGINGDEAAVYVIGDNQLTELLRAPKDVWPLRLAQFGSFQFPAGRLPSGRVYAYGVAVEGFDNVCLSLREH